MEEKYYLSRKGNVLRIICKNQEPLRPWTFAEVQDAIEYAKSKRIKHLIIDGDDSNINRNDDKTGFLFDPWLAKFIPVQLFLLLGFGFFVFATSVGS